MSHISYHDEPYEIPKEETEELTKWVVPDFMIHQHKEENQSRSITKETKLKPHGGPSSYYDMPFKNWVTVNDMMEYLAENKWGKYGIHLKDIFKGICRWGEKSGTTVEYDTRKIIYYGCRILQMVSGKASLRAYLQDLLNDPQFK